MKNLQTFTTMLATNDSQVRRLNADLASVSEQLDGERDDLAAALKNLAVALSEVSTFVHDNRAGLTTNLDQLASVTGTVAKQRDALAETLTNAPVALSNLQNAYNPETGTLDTRANVNENLTLQNLLCNLIVAERPAGLAVQDRQGRAQAGRGPARPARGARGEAARSTCSRRCRSRSARRDAPRRRPRTDGTVQMRGADPTLGGLLEATR